MDATIVDLRYRMKEVLRAIERGETVTVSYRGKPKATLSPIFTGRSAGDDSGGKTADQPFFGMWRGRQDLTDPASYLRILREARAVSGISDNKKRPARKPK